MRVLAHKLVHFASLTDSFIFNFQNYYSQTGKTEHQKYVWNVIVSQEKANCIWETKPQARSLISLWFCG